MVGCFCWEWCAVGPSDLEVAVGGEVDGEAVVVATSVVVAERDELSHKFLAVPLICSRSQDPVPVPRCIT